MTGPVALFVLWLFSKFKGGGPRPPGNPSAPFLPVLTASTHPATQAAADAHAATATAAATAKPSDIRKAFKASDDAKEKMLSQALALQKASKAPAPWRATPPTDLPPWPGGWEPDVPPDSAVVTRAWQLLPILWKKGKGSRQTETIKGRWITFVAADHGGGKKGITAFRVKGAKL